MHMQSHHNNFGFLRLMFAMLVIVSHSPEMIDGNRSREPLTNIIGHQSFGDLAVAGFFLISGYLILMSYINSRSILSYIAKRIRRIYPGYLAAFSICLLIVSPVTGGVLHFGGMDIARTTANAFGLQGPYQPGFIGLPYEVLNGSMWTISYEFRCYLAIIIFSIMGLHKSRWGYLGITILLLILTASAVDYPLPGRWQFFFGDIAIQIRLLAAFCVGGCYYLFGDRIVYTWKIAAGSASVLLLSMYFEIGQEVAFFVLGGYIIIWFSLHFKNTHLSRINSNTDISYGVYLYAWPIGGLLIYFFSIDSPLLLFVLTLPLSMIVGWLSWVIVESNAIQKRPILPRKISGPVAAAVDRE